MTRYNIQEALRFVTDECTKMLKGAFPKEYFIITKTLRSYYKDPTRIAHNVLAQRIGKRDPGSKPRSNDRIAYIYIKNDDKEKTLQGDRIETPAYIEAMNLKIDYETYLTNQIMKPVMQILNLRIPNSEKIFEYIIENDRNEKMGMKKFAFNPNLQARTFVHRFIPVTDDIYADDSSSSDKESDNENDI